MFPRVRELGDGTPVVDLRENWMGNGVRTEGDSLPRAPRNIIPRHGKKSIRNLSRQLQVAEAQQLVYSTLRDRLRDALQSLDQIRGRPQPCSDAPERVSVSSA